MLKFRVHFFIWQAVFAGIPAGERVNGFSLEEMVTYISIGWIARSLYFSDIDEEIGEMVRTGQISMYLLRPVHFHLMMLSQALGGSLFRLIFFTSPIALVILTVFPVSLPASFASGALFLCSTLFSFLIFAEINFLVGLLAFSFKNIDGVMRAKYFLIQLFSGLLLPISFFPDWLEPILSWLPLKSISYVPLQFYLGKIEGTAIATTFLELVAWILVLYVLGQLLWRREVQRLTIQGG